MERNEILEIFNRIRRDDAEMLFNPHAFSYEGLEVILKAKSDYYALVFLKGEVIGYCLLRGIDEGFVDFSVGIFIFSNYRKMGYGREIMSYLETFALSRNVRTLRLSVKRNNVVAKNLYAKLGYRKITDKDINFEIWRKQIISDIKHPE
jgi:RimJ/RimL family protein N-acetyltransferase